MRTPSRKWIAATLLVASAWPCTAYCADHDAHSETDLNDASSAVAGSEDVAAHEDADSHGAADAHGSLPVAVHGDSGVQTVPDAREEAVTEASHDDAATEDSHDTDGHAAGAHDTADAHDTAGGHEVPDSHEAESRAEAVRNAPVSHNLSETDVNAHGMPDAHGPEGAHAGTASHDAPAEDSGAHGAEPAHGAAETHDRHDSAEDSHGVSVSHDMPHVDTPSGGGHDVADSHGGHVEVGHGDGLVFDNATFSEEHVPEEYSPDWDRYQKEGLFGAPAPAATVTSMETEDVLGAESHYAELLRLEIPDSQRRNVLLEMAEMYHKANVKPKEAAVYERYIEAYPQDEMVPELYMRLGFLYRDIGVFHTALAKFYSVLNSSLAVNRSGIQVYKLLSLRAQMEIADTYYMMGDYDQALKFYLRLKRLNMSSSDRVSVDFKYAYTQYLSKDLPATISSFQAFVQSYPDDPLVAEAHFVLANAYREINQDQSALAEVLNLLQYQSRRGEDTQTWTYWKKRTGNQIGNEFYEQGDYESALYIYQAMARLSESPDWLWPALYQMGLCLERLRLTKKAVDAYNVIIDGSKDMESKGQTLPSNLSDIVDQVQWRKDHLNWVEDTQSRMQQIMGQ